MRIGIFRTAPRYPVGIIHRVIWFDHTQSSPLLPMASTGHPSMASLQSASSGVVGCLKYIGVAAVVAAREISGCGFPAQVAVNALVIAVKLTGHVFRVFIRNVGHRFSFVLCRWNSIRAFRDTVAEYLFTRMCATRSFTAPIRHLLGMLRHDR